MSGRSMNVEERRLGKFGTFGPLIHVPALADNSRQTPGIWVGTLRTAASYRPRPGCPDPLPKRAPQRASRLRAGGPPPWGSSRGSWWGTRGGPACRRCTSSRGARGTSRATEPTTATSSPSTVRAGASGPPGSVFPFCLTRLPSTRLVFPGSLGAASFSHGLLVLT